MFADIFNVLLFKKKLITPDRLRPLSVETIYKAADGYLGMQERDVITIVLNFSKTKWTSPLSLKQILQIPQELAEYVQDYKIHVFNIAHLPRKVRNQFTSDFKVVADYFSEKESPDYQPGNEEIQHVEAVLTLLRVFTNDDRYDSIIRDVKKNK